MKKYLTAAALLAAGTAFANAATVITLTDLSQNVSGDISYNASTGYLTGSSLFTAYSIASTNRSTASTTISLDLTALGMATEGSTYSGTTQLVKYQTTTSTDGAIGIAATQYGVQFTWGNSVWSTASGTFVSWDTLRGDSYTKGGNTYVVLTLEAPARRGSGASTSVGSQIYNSDGGDFTWTNTAGNTGTGFGYSGLVANVSYDTIYLNSDYISAVSVFAGAATTSEIAAASQLVIPEPSAFGLIAGAGALALVASRRRRRAK